MVKSTKEKKIEKEKVLAQISGNRFCSPCGRAKYSIDGRIIHVRFCSTDKQGSSHYKFNINPNTLVADYELWICGSSTAYYLIPITIIKTIYHDPEAYIDNYHPEIRVVSVRTDTDRVTYASGGKSIDLTSHLCGII